MKLFCSKNPPKENKNTEWNFRMQISPALLASTLMGRSHRVKENPSMKANYCIQSKLRFSLRLQYGAACVLWRPVLDPARDAKRKYLLLHLTVWSICRHHWELMAFIYPTETYWIKILFGPVEISIYRSWFKFCPSFHVAWSLHVPHISC